MRIRYLYPYIMIPIVSFATLVQFVEIIYDIINDVSFSSDTHHSVSLHQLHVPRLAHKIPLPLLYAMLY